jgi:hypothetical protein
VQQEEVQDNIRLTLGVYRRLYAALKTDDWSSMADKLLSLSTPEWTRKLDEHWENKEIGDE